MHVRLVAVNLENSSHASELEDLFITPQSDYFSTQE